MQDAEIITPQGVASCSCTLTFLAQPASDQHPWCPRNVVNHESVENGQGGGPSLAHSIHRTVPPLPCFSKGWHATAHIDLDQEPCAASEQPSLVPWNSMTSVQLISGGGVMAGQNLVHSALHFSLQCQFPLDLTVVSAWWGQGRSTSGKLVVSPLLPTKASFPFELRTAIHSEGWVIERPSIPAP
ncbi:hypothetical protein AMAG_18649 [Allomyces macrogynus ATCC 38327]|uniref:Uncharacterized protein n=1 Tax=Allomyces macrogynus (strain ATCC 38327) TaxID=578462 RepID=A0A0L0SGK1_ALLM3|nr:hypothetical protein AMAG_18649 [Allomyces macrogynus ATCC 38327]|eukprot:KNE61574.1 hypothetical protein AMAG_18649 [Allomyces macrogynus ATCC 38327]